MHLFRWGNGSSYHILATKKLIKESPRGEYMLVT